jgi:hypothetical protein
MNELTTGEPANDPQDLERLLVERENAGDVTGMTALFEPDAVVDIGDGTFLQGKEAIHEFFTKLQVTGFGSEKRKFEFGEQRPGGRTRVLHPWRPFSRRHLAEKHDARLVSCSALRRTLIGVLGKVSEDSQLERTSGPLVGVLESEPR